MHPPRLRKSCSDDSEFIYFVYNTAARPMVEAAGRRWAEAKMREKATAEASDALTDIVVCEGVDVGFFSLEDRQNELWLHSLFLLPEHQRRGIGSVLVANALRSARELRKPVRLQVMTFSPTRGYYERHGFTTYKEADGCFYMQSAA